MQRHNHCNNSRKIKRYSTHLEQLEDTLLIDLQFLNPRINFRTIFSATNQTQPNTELSWKVSNDNWIVIRTEEE